MKNEPLNEKDRIQGYLWPEEKVRSAFLLFWYSIQYPENKFTPTLIKIKKVKELIKKAFEGVAE